MNGTGDDNSGAPPLSLAQAKANLLAQGEIASRELDEMIARTKADVVEVVDDVTRNVKRTIPWAAAAAVAAGVFMGRKGRHRGTAEAVAGEVPPAPASRSGRTFEKLKWVATTVGPVLVDYFMRPKPRGAGSRGRDQ